MPVRRYESFFWVYRLEVCNSAWSFPMTTTSIDGPSRLTADALHLALSLDSFTTLDWAERIGPSIQQGKIQLAELQRRRDLLIVTRDDGAIIGWLLETIDARLKFLECLLAAMCPTTQNEKDAAGNGGDARPRAA